MSRQRKQANQLEKGDRFLVPLKLAFEVQTARVSDGVAHLSVSPVPCGPSCSETCGCQSSLLLAHGGPFQLGLDAKRKLEYLGNLSELLAALEQTQAQIQRLQVERSPANGTATGQCQVEETTSQVTSSKEPS